MDQNIVSLVSRVVLSYSFFSFDILACFGLGFLCPLSTTLSNCYQCFPLCSTLFSAFLAHYRGSNFLFSYYYRLFPYFRSSPNGVFYHSQLPRFILLFSPNVPFPDPFSTSWMEPTMTLGLLTSSFS
ncbi:hypothetical protein V8G54_005923 [Vigna mungo]|uniref:Uncharacterized protein n=1 Tax=Vigna mungo TaxID=3915 RepID=A0AAQ3S7I4_VIGMU